MCIGQKKRGFVSLEQARDRVLVTLRSLANWQPIHRGFFFHWVNIDTGERILDSEVSSVDTALLLCGVLTCKAHFKDPEVIKLASLIFDRVEWTWLSEDTPLLPHGWTPEFGFLPYHWDLYSELMMVYLLGLGSSSHPLPENTWDVWKRTTFEYDGIRYVGSFGPLFIKSIFPSLVRFQAQARSAMRIISRTPYSRLTSTGASVSTCQNNFPITATICGALPLRTPTKDIRCGEVRLSRALSMERWRRARPRARCPSNQKRA